MPCYRILCCAVLQVSVIRNVEIELEAALEKLRGAAKDLQKGVKEAMKLAADAQKDLKQYMPGGWDCRCEFVRMLTGLLNLGLSWLTGCTRCMMMMPSGFSKPPTGTTTSLVNVPACSAATAEDSEPYVVPDEAGDINDAFLKVNELDEQLRVMQPDLGAIQVRGGPAVALASSTSQRPLALCIGWLPAVALAARGYITAVHTSKECSKGVHSSSSHKRHATSQLHAQQANRLSMWCTLPRLFGVAHVCLLPCTSCLLPQAYREKASDFEAKQSEYAAVTAERDEVGQPALPPALRLLLNVCSIALH